MVCRRLYQFKPVAGAAKTLHRQCNAPGKAIEPVSAVVAAALPPPRRLKVVSVLDTYARVRVSVQ
jgi:hypothetical protein